MNGSIKKILEHLCVSAIDWLFRRRSIALYVMRIGLVCIVASSVGPSAFDIVVRVLFELNVIKFDSIGLEIPPSIRYVVLGIGSILIVTGLTLEKQRRQEERKREERKKIIVIEVRGLRDTTGDSLVDAVSQKFLGHRDQLLIDLRQGIKDGEIVAPEVALRELISLPTELKRRERGLDRNDLTTVFGGLASVPYMFLAGVLIDDECAVTVYDWDRHDGTWHELNQPDDHQRFERSGLHEVPDTATEIALSVSVSYSIKPQDIRDKISNIPIVNLHLSEKSVDNHWSEAKQIALGAKFLDTLIGLAAKDIRRVHLFLAGPNSLVFRFGRLYDKRNLPEIAVYQYKKATALKYPWGILMPVSGIDEPILLTDDRSQVVETNF